MECLKLAEKIVSPIQYTRRVASTVENVKRETDKGINMKTPKIALA